MGDDFFESLWICQCLIKSVPCV